MASEVCKKRNSTYNFRRENQANLPAVKSTRYGLRSFRYEAARIWKCLPNELRLSGSFRQFMLGMMTFADVILVQLKLCSMQCFCNFIF